MSDETNDVEKKALDKLVKESIEKLNEIKVKIVNDPQPVSTRVQILIDIVDNLEDVLLYWEDTYIPDRLKLFEEDD